MAVRSSMAALIARVRLLINDPASVTQQFSDQDIQDVLDEARSDIFNYPLEPKPTYSGTTIQFLQYVSDVGGWEDDLVLKEYLTVVVTPSLSENIPGVWTFAQTTLPPVFITGKLYDVYRAAADLLERWAARWTLAYTFSSDGQSFQRSQVTTALQTLAHTYRLKQRVTAINFTRTDMNAGEGNKPSLQATEFDYFATGH